MSVSSKDHAGKINLSMSDTMSTAPNWIIFLISFVIFLVAQTLLIVAALRFRRRDDQQTPEASGSNPFADLVWTIIPALLLAGVFWLALQHLLGDGIPGSQVPSVPSADAFQMEQLVAADAFNGTPDLAVVVTGKRWWWELDYQEQGFHTAADLYVPVGATVLLEMMSADEPRTWWAPAGNDAFEVTFDEPLTLSLQATEPGTYEGVCQQQCDDPTAYLPLRIIAVEPTAFEAWVALQRAPAPEPTNDLVQEGEVLMSTKACLGCHALGGMSGQSRVGPNLTGMALRQQIAGVVPYSPENMRQWMEDPIELKPGTTMPRLQLTDAEIEALVAYMDTLQ